jgi:hypothetical protein
VDLEQRLREEEVVGIEFEIPAYVAPSAPRLSSNSEIEVQRKSGDEAYLKVVLSMSRAHQNPDRPARCQASETLKSFINRKAREIMTGSNPQLIVRNR